MAGSSRAIKSGTEKTEKVVDTNKPSDEKVGVQLALGQTKHNKDNATVIPAKKRLVKRMMFDSVVNSFTSSSAFCFRSSSAESDQAADDDHLPLTIPINDKKNNNILPDPTS